MAEEKEVVFNLWGWFKLIRRIMSWLSLLLVVCVAAWIFWPIRQPTEEELLRLVPNEGTVAVFVQRDLDALWPAFRHSQFFKTISDAPWVPVRVSGDSPNMETAEKALFSILGKRLVGFVSADPINGNAGGVCLLVPVTPRAKWVWVQLQVSKHLKWTGVRIENRTVERRKVSELKGPLPPDFHLRFARVGNAVALALDGPTDSVAATIQESKKNARGTRPFESALDTAGATNEVHCGAWRQKSVITTWRIQRPQPKLVRIEWSLPKQRTVRVPWDEFSGPRTMGLIQKLFTDTGLLTVRGRASHFMAAWDNSVAWIGIPPDWYAEDILLRTKYREHLSHGQFPWSGAGDEFAFVVSPATANTLHGLPAMTFALRCWQTNDTQMAMAQFLPSLRNSTGSTYLLDPPSRGRDYYTVTMLSGGKPTTLFHYRYVDGLVLATNSDDQFQKFDPKPFANEKLEPAQPENQFNCNAKETGAAVRALAAILGSSDLEAAGKVLETLSEVRLTIRLEKQSVNYVLEAKSW